MSQGGQWSRMIFEEAEIDNIDSSPIGTQPIVSQPIASERSASKKKPIRAANYSQQEDLQLCESWENISMDPITANEQPSSAYWKRIHENHHANKKFESSRTTNSLEHRWGIIYKELQKFQGYFEEVERRHPSGVPFQEHVLEAQTIYADKEPNKKGFPFYHCWLKVRHCPKFTALLPSKRPRTSNSTPIDVPDQEEDDSGKSQTPDSSMPSAKRPMGRKQAKEKLKKGGEQMNYAGLLEKLLTEKEKIRENRWQENKMMQERKVSIEERKVSLEERKVATEEKKMIWDQEQKIMFCDLNTLEPTQKTYVIAMRAQIAAEKMAAFNSAFGGHDASGGHGAGEGI